MWVLGAKPGSAGRGGDAGEDAGGTRGRHPPNIAYFCALVLRTHCAGDCSVLYGKYGIPVRGRGVAKAGTGHNCCRKRENKAVSIGVHHPREQENPFIIDVQRYNSEVKLPCHERIRSLHQNIHYWALTSKQARLNHCKHSEKQSSHIAHTVNLRVHSRKDCFWHDAAHSLQPARLSTCAEGGGGGGLRCCCHHGQWAASIDFSPLTKTH